MKTETLGCYRRRQTICALVRIYNTLSDMRVLFEELNFVLQKNLKTGEVVLCQVVLSLAELYPPRRRLRNGDGNGDGMRTEMRTGWGQGAHKSTSDACMQSEDGPSSMHVRVRHRPCMSTIHRHLLRATVYLHAAYHRRHRTSFNVALPKKCQASK